MQTVESGSQGFRGEKNSIEICVRDHSRYILVKNVGYVLPMA